MANRDLDHAPNGNGTRDRSEVNGAGSPRIGDLAKKVLTALASLRLTVVLFSLAIVLVLFGTLAQVESGLYTVLRDYFRTLYAWIPFRLIAYVPAVKNLLPPPSEISGGFPFPGGWLIGGALLVNLLAAHAVRFRLTWKRSGVLILHLGVIVLLVSELVTGLLAVEAKMVIAEGETMNFVDVSNKVELAITDTSNVNLDDVVTIPGSMLKRGGVISDDSLPVDIVVLRFMKNTELVPVRQSDARMEEAVTASDGLLYTVEERPEERGVGGSQRDDAPGALVELRKKGTNERLGTYLVSLWYYPNYFLRRIEFAPQRFALDGKTYQIELRYRRVYKPYSVRLIDFRFDRYPGTTKPKNYSSLVRFADPTRDEDRELLIYMNTPLRHAGEALYQGGFDNMTERITVLQVVDNPGWLMPYISCALVSLGMLVHFSIHLCGFLQRRSRSAVTSTGKLASPPEQKASWQRILLPGSVVSAVALFIAMPVARESSEDDSLKVDDFGKVPVLHQGRVQPLDTLARTSLRIISERSTFRDSQGREQPAIRFLLDIMSGNGEDQKHKVFRIENEQVLSLLGLERREGYRYAFDEFGRKLPEIRKQVKQSESRSEQDRELFDVKVLKLAKQLDIYFKLRNQEIPNLVPPQTPDEQWQTYLQVEAKAIQRAVARIRAELAGRGLDLSKFSDEELLERFRSKDETYAKLVSEIERDRSEISPAAQSLTQIFAYYQRDDSTRFNSAVADYRRYVEQLLPDQVSRPTFEHFFNRLDLFYRCAVLYVIASILGCIAWLDWARVLNRVAFWILIATLVAHTFALIARMYLMDRPFVFITNLYSTAVFIGWACVILGLILESIYQNGLGNVLGGVIGFVTLVIAHHLGSDKDTLEMMEAVLDTNFWLATHVTVVNLGYAATFAAGFLGIMYVLRGVLTRTLDNEAIQTLGRMTYGTLCFAMFCSFTGTVLGGIWADQSWGRFWGWDPKENGALMIVLWNALILHARWGGLIKHRGIAVLAIVGNIITAWSYFGTNLLGVGLHSYGFTSGVESWLGFFWVTQLVLIIPGLLPLTMWRSFAPRPAPIRVLAKSKTSKARSRLT